MTEGSDSLVYALSIERRTSKRLGEIKELTVEKLRDVKDTIENNKRKTVYIVATVASGIAFYAITGSPLGGLAASISSTGFSVAHNVKLEK